MATRQYERWTGAGMSAALAVALWIAVDQAKSGTGWETGYLIGALAFTVLAVVLAAWAMFGPVAEKNDQGKRDDGPPGIGVFDSKAVNVNQNLIRGRKPHVGVYRSKDIGVTGNVGEERLPRRPRKSWLFGEMPWKKKPKPEGESPETSDD